MSSWIYLDTTSNIQFMKRRKEVMEKLIQRGLPVTGTLEQLIKRYDWHTLTANQNIHMIE
jgi:hypothetical protein